MGALHERGEAALIDRSVVTARAASGTENCITGSGARAPRVFALLAALAIATAFAPVAGAASSCTCGFSDGKFTLATITIDGASTGASGPLTGWDTVKADTDNNVCDANSTGSPTELGGADGIADQPQALGRDLTWFSFTWNATNIFFFTERAGNSNSIQRFVYYGDTNNNGLMEQGERVIQVEWNGSNRLVKIYRASYNAVAIGGDGLADTSGVADGYILPGTLTQIDALNAELRSGNWGSTDGSQMEFYVSWSELTGSATPRAIRFHVSSLNGNFNNNNPPNGTIPGFSGVEDNMAGCGGGTGSTQFADVAVTSPLTITEPHDTLTCALMTVTNNGNADDRFELTNSIGTFSGAGGGTPSISYFFDTNANGVYNAGTDLALTDSGGATGIDTGLISPLATKSIFICSTATGVNAYTPSGSATVTTTYTSNFNNLVSAANTTTVTVLLLPNITLTKTSAVVSDPTNGGIANDPKRIPGSYVDYTITATNTGGGALTSNTTVITDPIPANTDLFVNSLGGSPTNSPVTQTDGSPACGLTLSFSSAATQALRLADQTDGVNFSTTASAPYTYNASPTPDGNGVASTVTALRIAPTGVFAGASAAGNPSCSWTFRVRVE